MMMDKMKVLAIINEVKNSNVPVKQKEEILHELERQNQNELFIKTDYCPNCNELTVDVWFKQQRFVLK